jgi:sulfatase maturation enzyme AslB (radical SAM superfamily)
MDISVIDELTIRRIIFWLFSTIALGIFGYIKRNFMSKLFIFIKNAIKNAKTIDRIINSGLTNFYQKRDDVKFLRPTNDEFKGTLMGYIGQATKSVHIAGVSLHSPIVDEGFCSDLVKWIDSNKEPIEVIIALANPKADYIDSLINYLGEDKDTYLEMLYESYKALLEAKKKLGSKEGHLTIKVDAYIPLISVIIIDGTQIAKKLQIDIKFYKERTNNSVIFEFTGQGKHVADIGCASWIKMIESCKDFNESYHLSLIELIYPKRVNFNFLEECNMTCNYCFNCFISKNKVSENKINEIFQTLSSWPIEGITISGGDPFKYGFLKDSIKKYLKVPFIHVDTNGMSLTENDYPFLDEFISLVGFPLDGSNEQVHGLTRTKEHYKKIICHLDDLRDHKVVIKVNTVLHDGNIDDIDNIAKLLSDYRVKLWSIYDFWRIQNTPSAKVDNIQFKTKNSEHIIISMQKKFQNLINIEHNPVTDRSEGYFFVNNVGTCYGIKKGDEYSYVNFGDVKDSMAIKKWEQFGNNQQLIRLRRRKMLIK